MSWMHLEPIFSSADIQRQLPSEAKQFSFIEREFKRIMKRAADDPNCMKLCSLKGLRENFVLLHHNFERIKRSLQDYLEMKRMAFPRFFFLSDDELIQLLSRSRDLNIVQMHITKCFQGVKGFVLAEREFSANSLAKFLNSTTADGPTSIQNSRGNQTFLTENSEDTFNNITRIGTSIQGMTAKEDESVYFDNAIKVS
jgi:dynein heavy chain